MKTVLAVLFSILPLLAYCADDDWALKVDVWTKICAEKSCTLILHKEMKDAKNEEDYFALGIQLSKDTGTPEMFFYSGPVQQEASQVIITFLTRSPAGLATKEITSFGLPPCRTRTECIVRFSQTVVTPNIPGGFQSANMWDLLQSRNLLLISHISNDKSGRVERSAMVTLAAFKHAASEFRSSLMANPAVQGTLRDKAAQRP